MQENLFNQEQNDTQFIDERDGLLFPWYTKPFLDELITWKLDDKKVFEYGAGYSTVWWSKHAQMVVAVDSDYAWLQRISGRIKELDIPNNLKLLYHADQPGVHPLKSKYVQSAGPMEQYDIIVIDGNDRDWCVAHALMIIKDGGIIICDNWDQDYVWNSAIAKRLLAPFEHQIYTQPDHTNHDGRPWKTGWWKVDKSKDHILWSANPYDSHRPLLWLALEEFAAVSDEPNHDQSYWGWVREFGMGNGSTPVLHEFCKMARLRLFSYESDPQWLNKFTHLETDWHELINIGDWDSIEPLPGNTNLILIDHAPGERRKIDIQRYRDAAEIIIVHDTEVGAEYVYGMNEVLCSFKYKCDLFTPGRPQTTAVSNTIDVSRWKGITFGIQSVIL